MKCYDTIYEAAHELMLSIEEFNKTFIEEVAKLIKKVRNTWIEKKQ